jgi:predicted ATPase
LEVHNFGPIKEGNVEIKPLTIFLGRNNTGKSYMAMLTHTFVESMLKYSVITGAAIYHDMPILDSGFQDVMRRRARVHHDIPPIMRNAFSTYYTNNIKHLRERREVQLPEEITDAIFENTVKSFQSGFKDLFVEEMERIFGCNIFDLRQHGSDSLQVDFMFNGTTISFKCKNHETELSLNCAKPNVIFAYTSEIGPSMQVRYKANTIKISFSRDFLEIRGGSRSLDYASIILREIFEAMENSFLRSSRNMSFYLPAARSGILSAHKVVASGLLRQLPYVGLKKMEFLPLSGTITDFLANIIQLQKRHGEFFDLATDLENQLIEGRIDIKEAEKLTYPEIFYKTKNLDMPLHRSSSMVSEIAPLVLYLKYILVSGSRLIIEEPESHLHPGAQRKLAKFLARLSKNKVSIIMTSHSDYLLHQIQNLVLLSNVPEEKLTSLGYDAGLKLSKKDVSVYLFKNLDRTETVVQPVDISNESLENSGFDDVVQELYEESVKIDRAQQKKCT